MNTYQHINAKQSTRTTPNIVWSPLILTYTTMKLSLCMKILQFAHKPKFASLKMQLNKPGARDTKFVDGIHIWRAPNTTDKKQKVKEKINDFKYHVKQTNGGNFLVAAILLDCLNDSLLLLLFERSVRSFCLANFDQIGIGPFWPHRARVFLISLVSGRSSRRWSTPVFFSLGFAIKPLVIHRSMIFLRQHQH